MHTTQKSSSTPQTPTSPDASRSLNESETKSAPQGSSHRTPTQLFGLHNAHKLARRRASLLSRSNRLQSKIEFHQKARLTSAGVFFLSLVVAALRPDWGLGLPAVLLFGLGFSWLVVRTGRFTRHRDSIDKLNKFYARQESRALGQPSGRHPFPSFHLPNTHQAPQARQAAQVARPHGAAHEQELTRADNADNPQKNSTPSVTSAPQAAAANSHLALEARDLGYFGPHSLWTLLDETLTDDGQRELAGLMTARPEAGPEAAKAIEDRQKTTQKLKRERWFYTRLTLESANEIDEKDLRLSTSQVSEFLAHLPSHPLLPLAFATVLLLWLAFITIVIWSVATDRNYHSVAWGLFAIVNLGVCFGIGSGFSQAVGLSHHLGQLLPIFARLERRTLESAEIRALCPMTHNDGPAKETRKLNRVLGILGVETNPLLHLLLNSALPWSLTGMSLLTRSQKRLAKTFPSCLRELAALEVYGSLVIFAHYQTQTYPTLNSLRLDVKDAFHPFIDRTRVVANDFAFPQGKSLGLLTGSNMSGKSTFLRTLGINQTLANLGAPVFAESFATRPLTIESCIEVSDSLRDGFSYFYAEVRRLKSLLDSAQTHEGTLFLIDEIFRGTNNRERQIGSRAVIRQLANCSGAQGFISTHDLELTNLEGSEPSVLNLHFREEVIGTEMLFPYKIHTGPCPTTNALKIMEATGIHIDQRDLVSI